MEAVELAGLDIAANDAVELLASDTSTARALFDGVPAARLLARARARRHVVRRALDAARSTRRAVRGVLALGVVGALRARARVAVARRGEAFAARRLRALEAGARPISARDRRGASAARAAHGRA